MPYEDLREFLARLQAQEELKRIKVPVHWDEELGAIVRRNFDARGPALLFEDVKDSSLPLLCGALATTSRMALALEVEPRLPLLIDKVMMGSMNPVPPAMVKSGPCQEKVLTGREIDLSQFPAPKWNPLDGGRFLGTLGAVIARDPETGIRNMGIYRQQLLGKDRVGLLATQQIGIILQKYRQLGQDMPVATAIGLDPAIIVAAVSSAGYGTDELAIAGALRGEPLQLVKCHSLDLEVPASAEVVLEGVVPADSSKWEEEGPFGEFTGYYAGVRAIRPTVYLTAVTLRQEPIFQGTLEGAPPCESNMLKTVAISAGLKARLLRTGLPGIKDVYVPESGCGHFTVIISLSRQYYQGQGRQIMETLWGVSRAKWTIVVDEDIDVYDRAQVEWALATRVQPHRDIIITPNREPGVDLDASIAPELRPYPFCRSSRIGIDATEKFKGFDFPPLARPRPEVRALVEKRWKEYGF